MENDPDKVPKSNDADVTADLPPQTDDLFELHPIEATSEVLLEMLRNYLKMSFYCENVWIYYSKINVKCRLPYSRYLSSCVCITVNQ